MKSRLSKMGEFGLIDFIKTRLTDTASVIEGIGDDTAVVSYTPTRKLLLTTDMLVEDVHFTKDTAAKAIGYKCLACSISDIAAMGGTPKHALVSLGVSGQTRKQFIKEVYAGINLLARKYNVAIVGGDTVKSDKLILNIALTGEVELKNVIKRSGARVGDQIFVTGKLGGSLKSGRHLNFVPRVKESKYLVKYYKPSSMIDILEASNVGAHVFEESIPLHKDVTIADALYDGEDFELLFTLSAKKADKLLKRNLGEKFYRIGEIREKKDKFCIIDKDWKRKDLSRKGFQHF
ncbi:MAG: thiamine-monophosphate kinase [Lysobacterales bacterium]|jgi:thiamine-monophosphate kinase